MFHALKKIGCAVLLAGMAQSAFAYALLGPLATEPWQVPAIGYRIGGDIGTPRNIGEEFRWNTPVVYYAFDNNFLTYFGSNGVAAVEQAIAILNNLTNYSAMSSDLSEFPLESQRVNYQAQALSLLDLKSQALHLLIEELGLAEPSRWVWTLRNRIAPTGSACPVGIGYATIQRNWDPVFTNQPVNSSYVNGTLYDYLILEFCGGTTTAITENFSPDPTANTPSAVADFSANFGTYNTGLTRDDVGGLRYLMGTNNVNYEAVSGDSQQLVTNSNNRQLLTTSNLALLLQQSLTNSPAALALLYPGLISTATNIFTNQVTTNITAVASRPVNAPAGTFTVTFVTNYTTNAVTLFSHTFLNVVTNHFYTNGYTVLSFTNIVNGPPNSPPGTLGTNIVNTVTVTSFPNGDFYIIPSNSLCSSSGYSFVSLQLVTTNAFTNSFGTNVTGNVTNGQPAGFSIITISTNYTYVVDPIQCISGSNSVSLREGIDKMTFVRTSFDSLIGQAFVPITNNYSLTAITNSALLNQSFQRILIRPDFLFSAEDRGAEGGNAFGAEVSIGFRTVPNWNANNVPTNNPGAAFGPGTIQPPVIIEFNKVGVLIINFGDGFSAFGGLLQSDGFTNYVWGSFDGTTNAPIIYPDGSSLNDLENQVLLQVLTGSLPDGTVGVPYSTQLQGSGGQLPYTWSLATNSPALPPGLSISAAGIISGTPSTAGTYDFTVAFMEAGARTTSRSLAITVH